MIDHSLSMQRARDGVRGWVRSAGAGLRKASPYGIVAFLAASAVAPVAGAALGAPAELSATLNQLGGMGSNYLSNAMVESADRLRGAGPDGLRDELAAQLLARLDAGDTGLRDELGELLQAVGAVEVALQEADASLRHELAQVFGSLGTDMGRLHLLAEDAAASLAALSIEQRQQTSLIEQALYATHEIRQTLRGRSFPPSVQSEAGADPGGTAPYPGMASFETLDARFFRGRETLVAELLGRLSEQLVGGPPLILVGASGAGKSSLLRAGVLPAIAAGQLGEGTGAWPWVVLTPGATPLATLRGRLAAVGDPSHVIVVVDQFEELFTQCGDPAERLEFATALAGLGPALLIVAVRADFYPQCTELPPLVDMLNAGQVVVGPLGEKEVRRVIREPAAIAGYRFEPGLEDVLLAEHGGALPLLAHALRATWERRDGDTLTVRGYRDTGGIRRAVAKSAEDIYQDLDEAGRTGLRRAMLSLVTIVDDLPVRRRAALDEVDIGVLWPMVSARLVTVDEETVEVSHEALLTEWPRLAGWLAEERQTILLRQRLALATADWAAAGEDPDAVYRGARLEAAREWAAGQPDLPEAQRRFLAAGESAARRSTNRLRRLVAGLAVLLLLAVAGGVVALIARNEAENNRLESLSRQYAAESRRDIGADDRNAITKALDAWAAAPTVEARSALISAQQAVTLGSLDAEEGARSVAVSPDGRRVALGYADGHFQLWDTATRRQIGTDRQASDGILSGLRFSPDGRHLASGSLKVGDSVTIWDAATGEELRRLPAFGPVVWLPDATLLASRLEPSGQMLGVWRPADGRLLRSIKLGGLAGLSLAASDDGAYAAVGGPTHSQLVRLRDGVTVRTMDEPMYDVAFTADGKLITLSVARELVAWEAATGRRIRTLSNPKDPVALSRIAVARDGSVLVQSVRANRVQRIKVDGDGARPELNVFNGYVQAAGLSADGHLLVLAGIGSPPLLVRLDVDRLPHPQLVGYLAVQPNGPLLATGSSDPQIRIWDTRTSDVAATIALPGSREGPLGLAYGADGTLAASVDSGKVMVFGPDGRLRRTLAAPPTPGALTISPDGTLVAAAVGVPGSDDYERQGRPDPDVLVWDLRTGQQVAALDTPKHLPRRLQFTPDSNHLVVAGNAARPVMAAGPSSTGALWQWAVDGWRMTASRLLPVGEGVSGMRISPDGARIAVAVGTGRASLFRTAGLEPAASIGQHVYSLSQVAWSPDGRTLATASTADADPVQLRSADTGDLIVELRAHGNPVEDLAFSPDGRMLATASGDWTVALFHLDPDDAVRRLCDVIRPAGQAEGRTLPRLCR